jgi:hypothetical protein
MKLLAHKVQSIDDALMGVDRRLDNWIKVDIALFVAMQQPSENQFSLVDPWPSAEIKVDQKSKKRSIPRRSSIDYVLHEGLDGRVS